MPIARQVGVFTNRITNAAMIIRIGITLNTTLYSFKVPSARSISDWTKAGASALNAFSNCVILDLFVKNKPSPMVKSRIPATNVGMIYAFAKSVFPSCQNPMLAIKNNSAKRMKNRVEKTSAYAHSVANFNSSIV